MDLKPYLKKLAGFTASFLIFHLSIISVLFVTPPIFQLPRFFHWTILVNPEYLFYSIIGSAGIYYSIQTFEDSETELREEFEEVNLDVSH
ncbi:hypothetical protein [Haloarcula litorea]|uniref:hypothetical protein n=1 Tax=Haloarcula litorea TaxID=3032579 RepID=UPI0023E7ACA5|nr:hypothetical protein [Halomicroarcula sp. GDY20]